MRSINIADMITVTSRGISVDVDITKLTDELLSRLVAHGIGQKVGDSASQAKSIAGESDDTVENITKNLMNKAIDALYSGEWAHRKVAAGVDEFTAQARKLVRIAVKAKFGAKSEDWATFTGLSDADQAVKLDGWYTANEVTFKPEVNKALVAAKAVRDAKDGMSKGVTFSF